MFYILSNGFSIELGDIRSCGTLSCSTQCNNQRPFIVLVIIIIIIIIYKDIYIYI